MKRFTLYYNEGPGTSTITAGFFDSVEAANLYMQIWNNSYAVWTLVDSEGEN